MRRCRGVVVDSLARAVGGQRSHRRRATQKTISISLRSSFAFICQHQICLARANKWMCVAICDKTMPYKKKNIHIRFNCWPLQRCSAAKHRSSIITCYYQNAARCSLYLFVYCHSDGVTRKTTGDAKRGRRRLCFDAGKMREISRHSRGRSEDQKESAIRRRFSESRMRFAKKNKFFRKSTHLLKSVDRSASKRASARINQLICRTFSAHCLQRHLIYTFVYNPFEFLCQH